MIIGVLSFLLIFCFSVSSGVASDIQKTTPVYTNTPQKTVLLAKKSTDEPKKNVPTYEKLMKDAVDQLFAVIESVDKSGLTQDEKQQKIHEFIMSVRFGPEMKDTFFAMTIQGVQRSAVWNPDIVNKDLSGIMDLNGVRYVAEMIRLSREKGEGFIQHLYHRYDGKLPVPAVSYVRQYKNWNMIYGTRVFLSDIEAYEVRLLQFPLSLKPLGPFFEKETAVGE